MKPTNIKLHTEELALDGFVPSDRYRIADSVKHELTRLLTEQGMPQSLSQAREIAHLDGGAFEAARGSRPEAIGTKVAWAVYRWLNR
jgi:hypothetical protein